MRNIPLKMKLFKQYSYHTDTVHQTECPIFKKQELYGKDFSTHHIGNIKNIIQETGKILLWSAFHIKRREGITQTQISIRLDMCTANYATPFT